MAVHICKTNVRILKLRRPLPCQDRVKEILRLQQPHLCFMCSIGCVCVFMSAVIIHTRMTSGNQQEIYKIDNGSAIHTKKYEYTNRKQYTSGTK